MPFVYFAKALSWCVKISRWTYEEVCLVERSKILMNPYVLILSGKTFYRVYVKPYDYVSAENLLVWSKSFAGKREDF